MDNTSRSSSNETEWKANEEFLQQLVDMGFSQYMAEQALYYTGNTSVEAAANFMFDTENDEEASSLTDSIKEQKKKLMTADATSETRSNSDETKDDSSVQLEDEFKMVFIVNTSLNMGVGKIAAQVAHACVGLYRIIIEDSSVNDAVIKWINEGEKKVVLKGDNHVHLQELQREAQKKQIHSCLIRDAGKTQIAPNSITVLSLFGCESIINAVSGKLSLL